MERASVEKPRVVQQADRVAAYFIVALLVLACVTAGWWYWHDPDRALWVFVSVLVVMALVRMAVRSMIKALGLSVTDRLLGMLFGKNVPAKFSHKSLILGGAILTIIGIKIMAEHLWFS